MHTTSKCVISASLPLSFSFDAFSFTVYLAFSKNEKKPKGVKCFVNELNELYQLSNVCYTYC